MLPSLFRFHCHVRRHWCWYNFKQNDRIVIPKTEWHIQTTLKIFHLPKIWFQEGLPTAKLIVWADKQIDPQRQTDRPARGRLRPEQNLWGPEGDPPPQHHYHQRELREFGQHDGHHWEPPEQNHHEGGQLHRHRHHGVAEAEAAPGAEARADGNNKTGARWCHFLCRPEIEQGEAVLAGREPEDEARELHRGQAAAAEPHGPHQVQSERDFWQGRRVQEEVVD